MNQSFDRSDEGKRVVTTEGDVVGTISSIDRGAAYVRPEPDLLDGLGSWISSYWDSDCAYKLDRKCVRAITANHIVVDTTKNSSPKMRSLASE